MVSHALFESSSGYAIFKVELSDALSANSQAAQGSINDLAKFGKMVSLMSFSPFKNAAHALENANDISEGASLHTCSLTSPDHYDRCPERVPQIPIRAQLVKTRQKILCPARSWRC